MKVLRYRKSTHVVERKIHGEHLLVPLMGTDQMLDSIYTLNATAGWIWEKAINGLTESEILASLTEEFDIDRQRAQEDVRKVLSDLLAIHALETMGE